MLGAEETHPSLFDSWPCGCMHSPHPSPSSPAFRRLDLLTHSCPMHHESPLAQNPLDGRGLLRNYAIPWDAPTPMCLWVPQFLRTPQLQNVFGLLQFDVFGDSREFCHSDIVVPLVRMQADGNEINQMIVQECLPTVTSITVFTAQSTNRSAFTKG